MDLSRGFKWFVKYNFINNFGKAIKCHYVKKIQAIFAANLVHLSQMLSHVVSLYEKEKYKLFNGIKCGNTFDKSI